MECFALLRVCGAEKDLKVKEPKVQVDLWLWRRSLEGVQLCIMRVNIHYPYSSSSLFSPVTSNLSPTWLSLAQFLETKQQKQRHSSAALTLIERCCVSAVVFHLTFSYFLTVQYFTAGFPFRHGWLHRLVARPHNPPGTHLSLLKYSSCFPFSTLFYFRYVPTE